MLNKFLYKVLSAVLALSMLLTVSPVFPVFAQEDGEAYISAISEKAGAEIPSVSGVIVKVKEGASVASIVQALDISLPKTQKDMRQRTTVEESLSLLPVGEEDISSVLEQLNENEAVIYAQPNYRIALSEIDINQWGLQNVGQSANTQQGTVGYDINVLNAWNVTQGSEDVVIGVIDSGIDINHESLSDKIWTNSNETANGTDDDENGYIDDLNGWDFVNDDNSVYDSAVFDEHGTHIAGIISSVAPNVKIMPLKAFSYNAGYTFDIINAIYYAEAMGVEIVNCSFASTEYNTALADAMEQSSMLFVCAAGNFARPTDELAPFPACYGFSNIISVAAIDSMGVLSPISTYGDKIDIAAPGINIYSTLPENKYGFKDGTSMAAAYTSGAAALVLSNNGELNAAEICQTLIESTITPVLMPEGTDETENLLDVTGALEYELPEEETRHDYLPSIGTQTEQQNIPVYPFSFSVDGGINTLQITEMIYDEVSILIQNPLEEKESAIVYEENSAGAFLFTLPTLQNEVEYAFNILLTENENVKSYSGILQRVLVDSVYQFEMYDLSENEYEVPPETPQTSVVYATAQEKEGVIETAAAGTKHEVENNNTRSFADRTYDDYDTYGYVGSSSDVDFYVISFSTSGVANFWLGNIPSGCDYELELRDGSGTLSSTTDNGVLLDSSKLSGNSDERIRYYNVTAGVNYYIRIYSYSGYSTTQMYLFRAKWYPAPDVYDAPRYNGNDSFSKATSISNNGSINANINYKLTDEQDFDFYKFTISATSVINITLTNIPSGTNYNMEIFNGASESNFIAGSYQSGTTSESYSSERSAGTYYIKVYSYSGYSVSNYKLTVTTAPAATPIGLNHTYNHSLGSSGEAYYSFTINQNTGLQIEIYNYTWDCDIYLYKKSGSTWTEVDYKYGYSDTINPICKSLTSGDYQILVRRYSGSGNSYIIKTTSTTTSLSSQITLSGFPSSMIAGEQKTVNVTVKNLGATVWTRSANFTLYDHTANTESTLFTSLPLQLTTSDNIEYGQTKTFTFTITAPNPATSPRTYNLGFVMRSNGSFFGAGQTSQISVTGFNDLAIPANTTVSGVTERIYRMNLSIGNYIFRTLYTSANSDTVLTLYNSAMTELAYNDDIYDGYTGCHFSRIERNITTSGTYYLKISGYNGAAVTCRVTANTYSDTTLISNATVNNQLEGFYQFTPSSAGTYVIATQKSGATNYDTYLFLLSSSGSILDTNDDGGDGNYSQITRSLTAGTTYYIRVSNYEYARNGRNTNVTCTLKVGVQSETPPTENQASVSITSPTNGNLIKVYNDNTVRIAGNCANVGAVTVSVNGSNLSNVRKSGNTFEASFKPTTSGNYTIRATGVATYGTTNPYHQVSVPIAVNDDGDTQATATKLTNGTERVAAVDFAGDADFFGFIPSESGEYELSVSSNIALQKTMYEASGLYAPLSLSGNPNTLSLSSGKTYYFKIQAQSTSATGGYTIKIENPTSTIVFPTYSEEITLRFGTVDEGYTVTHTGIDIQGYDGDEIISATNGTVVYVGTDTYYGRVVYVNSLFRGENIQIRYAHLKNNSVSVSVGDKVRSEQKIAEMGSTGAVVINNPVKNGLLEIEILRSTNGQPCTVNGSNTTKVNPLLYFPTMITNGIYMTEPYNISLGSSGSSSNNRYVSNLDLPNGQAYLRKIVEECIREKHGQYEFVNIASYLTYNSTTGNATVYLNGRSKTFNTSQSGVGIVNDRYIVNYNEFINDFYRLPSIIPESTSDGFGVQSMPGDESRSDYVQVLINGKYKDGKGGLSLAWDKAIEVKNDDDTVKYTMAQVRTEVAKQANALRDFDKAGSSFTNAYLINAPKGAGNMGHNAVLLSKSDGLSLFFSYYPSPESGWTAVGSVDGIMHFAVLDSAGKNDVLTNSSNRQEFVGLYWHWGTAKGYRNAEGEPYENNLPIAVNNTQGLAMAGIGAGTFSNPGKYAVLAHQCADVALDVLNANGKGVPVTRGGAGIPNNSFKAMKDLYGAN